ncbi:MAG: hypothetical protein K9K75_01785 [Deltaproteobacteria bacterium]|nr:hypothetical protein [Deltaproteobacteria bacterium]
MKNLNMKPFFYLLASFSAIILFLVAIIQGFDPRNFLDLLRLIPIVATADCFAYFVFTVWLWRWKRFQGWLIPFPDLNGTWQGHIQTNWKDAEGNIPAPIPTILAIKQSFGRMSCVMRTGEMESHSYLEGFCIDKDAQVRRLCYSYTSRPKAFFRERSTPQDGTMLFNIIGEAVHKLEGEYWTQRKTTGTVTLTFRTNQQLDEIPGDLPPHPMTVGESYTDNERS